MEKKEVYNFAVSRVLSIVIFTECTKFFRQKLLGSYKRLANISSSTHYAPNSYPQSHLEYSTRLDLERNLVVDRVFVEQFSNTLLAHVTTLMLR